MIPRKQMSAITSHLRIPGIKLTRTNLKPLLNSLAIRTTRYQIALYTTANRTRHLRTRTNLSLYRWGRSRGRCSGSWSPGNANADVVPEEKVLVVGSDGGVPGVEGGEGKCAVCVDYALA